MTVLTLSPTPYANSKALACQSLEKLQCKLFEGHTTLGSSGSGAAKINSSLSAGFSLNGEGLISLCVAYRTMVGTVRIISGSPKKR